MYTCYMCVFSYNYIYIYIYIHNILDLRGLHSSTIHVVRFWISFGVLGVRGAKSA